MAVAGPGFLGFVFEDKSRKIIKEPVTLADSAKGFVVDPVF